MLKYYYYGKRAGKAGSARYDNYTGLRGMLYAAGWQSGITTYLNRKQRGL
jgi:hypothetical protein